MLKIIPREMPEGKCLAGFSGGADSTALMWILAEERDRGRCEPEAIHINHGLRGEESDGDEAFCREICEELQIPLRTVRLRLDGRTDENACRKERFRCFQETMEKTGIRKLVLAHNRDDLAETLLMRLMRGAGTEGLACMSSLDIRDGFEIYRPLIGTGREEIREVLRRQKKRWREDSTNASDAYLRNRIRRQLIPLMEEMAEGSTRRIARTAEIVSKENRLLQEEADRFLAEHSDPLRIDTAALEAAPDALRSRILRTWWRRNAPETEEHALNAGQTDKLAALVKEAKGKVNLPGGITAVKGKHGIYLTGIQAEALPEVPYDPGMNGAVAFGKIMLGTSPSEGNPGNGMTEQEAPAECLRSCVIRTRRNGDRIRPFGMDGSRKLQDYLTDRGIDEPMRDRIPLLCRGNEVLLVAGVGAGAIPRWNPEKENIRLKWIGDMPWKRQESEEIRDGSKLGTL